MRVRPTVMAAIAATACLAPATGSAEVTAAGGEALRTSIAAGLDDILQHWLTDLAPGAPITVEPAGDHYEVTVPPLRMAGRDGNTIGFQAAVTPTQDGWFTVTPAFGEVPERPDAAALTAMSLSGSVTYAPAYRTIMAADLLISGLASPPTSPDRVHMDGVALDVSAVPRGGDRFDYATRGIMRGFAAEMPDGDRGAFGSVGAGISVGDIDLAAFAERLAAMDAAADADATPADRLSLLASLAAARALFFDGLRIDMGMDDVDLALRGAKIRYGHFALGLSIEGLRSGTGTLTLGLGWRDYATTALPAAVAVFAPSDAAVNLSLHGVPNAMLTTALDRFEAVSDSVAFWPAVGIALRELGPALLAADGLALDGAITGEAPIATFAADASLHGAPASPYRVSGTVNVTLGGIDDAIAALGADPQAQPMIQQLTMLKMFGVEAADPSGRPVRTYLLVLGPQGEATLNGTDIAPMLSTL